MTTSSGAVLVTGASSGMGKACALRLGHSGGAGGSWHRSHASCRQARGGQQSDAQQVFSGRKSTLCHLLSSLCAVISQTRRAGNWPRSDGGDGVPCSHSTHSQDTLSRGTSIPLAPISGGLASGTHPGCGTDTVVSCVSALWLSHRTPS